MNATRFSTSLAAVLAACAGAARAQSFSEGFEAGAIPASWTVANLSSPLGQSSWHAGGANAAGSVFFGPRGGSFMATVDYLCGSGVSTLSAWLIPPPVTLRNGDSLSFWTRSTNGGFPDRMQVRMSTAGSSANVGATATSVGDFGTLLLDVNPTYNGSDYPAGYPLSFRSFNLTVSGLAGPTAGRFAFRYFVENGGPSGSRSDAIGLDDVAYVSIADPSGACCLSDGTCATSVANVCTSQGGTYQGNGSTCAAAACPSGACCLPTLVCAISTASGCAAQGGAYRGDGSTCAAANCPSPGACCLLDGTCIQTSGPACAMQNGSYRGDETLCASAGCPGASVGPDVIVGEVYDISRDGTVGSITAYSIGTDSCNIGSAGVSWVSSTNQHPVISGNMFRLKTVGGAARFEQIGMSWFKNGFLATNDDFCGNCTTPAGSVLGPHGCSDVYTSFLNGDQANMGPRSAVNGTTGAFTYPNYSPGWNTTGDAIYKRCQVLTADVDPAQNAGALYFADAHYIAPDEARWTSGAANAVNSLNNYSYRRILISSATATPTFVPGAAGLTRQLVPGIQAWRDQDAGVTLVNADYLDTSVGPAIVSRFIVGARATDLGNSQWHFEYAVYNINADRAGGSFSVPLPPGTVVTNVGFHAPFYHSGEVFDNTPWNATVGPTSVTWTVAPFSPAGNANALRWGTMYSFRFDASAPPATGPVTLGLFKAGTPASIGAPGVPVPGVACYANCDSSTTAPVLNVADFTCFLNRYASGDPYGNCDGSTAAPVLNVADFTCFLQKFAAGCL
jgi:hypothetical protein